MKLIKNASIVIAIILVIYLVVVAIQEKNLLLASPVVVLFFVVTYFGSGIKVRSLLLKGNQLEINRQEEKETQANEHQNENSN